MRHYQNIVAKRANWDYLWHRHTAKIKLTLLSAHPGANIKEEPRFISTSISRVREKLFDIQVLVFPYGACNAWCTIKTLLDLGYVPSFNFSAAVHSQKLSFISQDEIGDEYFLFSYHVRTCRMEDLLDITRKYTLSVSFMGVWGRP